MGELLSGFKRTGLCANISIVNVGSRVNLTGWVQRRRDLGKLIFVWLRDYTGIVQVVFDESRFSEVFNKASQLRSEYVIAISGIVEKRTAENINPDLKTGQIEIIADELRILNESETPPFAVDDDVVVNDNVRYKYRYIDLRRPTMQKILRTRSKTAISVRNYFDENGFIEIETPVLCKSTPEVRVIILCQAEFIPVSSMLFRSLLSFLSSCLWSAEWIDISKLLNAFVTRI